MWTYRITSAEVPMGYGMETHHRPVTNCFLCPGNNLLAFQPTAVVGAQHGYVIPGSLPVNGTLVPMPFTALVVSANHFDDGRWLSELSALLKVIPDLGLQHYNFSINVGRSHGERPVPGVSPRHPFGWVIYGRDKFIEASTPTSGIGLATVVYQARVTAGSMPTEEVLLAIWEALPDDPNRLADYHDELYQMAASNRAIK